MTTTDIKELADRLSIAERQIRDIQRALGLVERPESDAVQQLREELTRADAARTEAISLLQSVRAMHGQAMDQVAALRARVAATEAEVAKLRELLALAVDCVDVARQPRPGFIDEMRAAIAPRVDET